MAKKSIHKNPAVIAAYVGGASMVIAAIATGILPQLFKPAKTEPNASISSGGGDINIGNGEKSTTTLVMGDQETTINYYNTDPTIVNELKQQLKLKNRTIATLLDTVDKNNVPANQQTAAFKKLAEKYANLQQRLNKYEHNEETKAAVKQALDDGDLDKAEQLLEQANAKDKLLIQERAQAIAERTFNLAEISELKYDFPTALARYKAVIKYQPEHLSAWWRIAKISAMLGDTQQALAAWQQLQQQAKEQGNERMYKIGLSGEADILAKHGYSPMALDKYQQAHQYFAQQAKRDPNNSDWQRNLSVSYERIGDMHKANGDGDKALNTYLDSLTIWKKLIKRDPNNMDWQRGITVPYNKIGDMHKANGDKALNAYLDSLKIAEKLAKRDPNNSDWQRDLSVSYERIGDMHKANGDGDKALNAYLDSIKIAEKLAKHNPNNAQLQRDLIISYVKFSESIPKDKKKYLQQALAVVLQLDKTNRLYPRDKWMIAELKKRLNTN